MSARGLAGMEWEYEYAVDDTPDSPGIGPVLRRPVARGPWEVTGTRAEGEGDWQLPDPAQDRTGEDVG